MLLLLLCGCAGKQEADVTKEMREASGFSSYAKVQYGDKEYGFTVKKDPQAVSIAIDTPETLKGFSVSLTQETYTIGYNGITFQTDRLPENMEKVIGPIFALLEAIGKGEGESLPDGTFEFSTSKWSAVCQFDMDSKTPLVLQVGDDFTLTFTEFTYT